MYDTPLKITRKRTAMRYLFKIEMMSMAQGDAMTQANSIRWRRLQWCISSIKRHIMDQLSLYGRKI